MNLHEILETLKDIAIACAAIMTTFVAYKGLTKWQEELRGKVDFDTARGLIRATYKLRDELQYARTPLVRNYEFPSDYPGPGKATSEQNAQGWAHVFKQRWAPVGDAIHEFEAQALEAEALWGEDVRVLRQRLSMCAHKLNVGMEMVVDNAASGGRDFEGDKEFARTVRADVYASPNATDNLLSNEISTTVKAIEDNLRTHLSRK